MFHIRSCWVFIRGVCGLASYDGSFVWAAETMRRPANLSQPTHHFSFSMLTAQQKFPFFSFIFKSLQQKQTMDSVYFHPTDSKLVHGYGGGGYAPSMQMAALDICFRWITHPLLIFKRLKYLPQHSTLQ